jgi:hypothetical protein
MEWARSRLLADSRWTKLAALHRVFCKKLVTNINDRKSNIPNNVKRNNPKENNYAVGNRKKHNTRNTFAVPLISSPARLAIIDNDFAARLPRISHSTPNISKMHISQIGTWGPLPEDLYSEIVCGPWCEGAIECRGPSGLPKLTGQDRGRWYGGLEWDKIGSSSQGILSMHAGSRVTQLAVLQTCSWYCASYYRLSFI